MLQIRTTAASFLAAHGRVAPIAPSRSPKAVLQNVLLDARADGAARFVATDLSMGLTADAPAIDVVEPGRCLVPSSLCAALAFRPKGEAVEVRVEGDQILASAGRWKARYPSLDPDLFPNVPGEDYGREYAEVAGDDFRAATAQTIYATDAESTRYALGGCKIGPADQCEDRLAFVATDGRRLAYREIPANFLGDRDLAASTVAPVRALKELARLLDPSLAVTIHADASALVFRQPGLSLYTRLVEGRFPRYQDVFPDPNTYTYQADIASEALSGAIGCIAACTSDESRGVDFAFTASGQLRFAAKAADVGDAEDVIEITPVHGVTPNTDVEVAFDPRYLRDAIVGSYAPQSFRFSLIDHKNAVVLTSQPEPSLKVVIMPLTRDR